MRRCEAAVRGGRGGVKAGWRRPDRRTGAPGSSVGGGAGGPPHAGDGGTSGRARIGAPGASGAVPGARAVVRLSSPGEDCGGSRLTGDEVVLPPAVRFRVVIPWRGWRRFTHTVNGRDVEFTFYRLSSPGGDLGVSHEEHVL